MSGIFTLDHLKQDSLAELGERADLESALSGITRASWQVITGVDSASITVVGMNGTPETVAPTDGAAVHLDGLQYLLCEGPCMQAVETGEDVLTRRIATDERWPRYGPRAAELGVFAEISLPLGIDGRTWGSLNLYSFADATFDDVSLETAELLAASAAVLLGLTRKVTTLSNALATRTTIGTAIGIVMERHGIDQDQAFGFLVRTSQNANTKLRQVACQIVDDAAHQPLS